MERFFNTAGPQKPDINYSIDPLSRFNLDEMLSLIRQQRYFVLHAPRQTGKTSCLLALRDLLNEQSDYIAVYANVEGGQASRNNVERVVGATCDTIAERFRMTLKSDLPVNIKQELKDINPDAKLATFLQRLSEAMPKPVVLFIDEIDALVGDSLVSVLRQLRSGYDLRPVSFPQSVVLCGVRDVRDYRIVLSNQDIVTGGSAFNVKAESLRLGNFSKREIYELYMQHTRETGQQWDEACFPMVWESTEGQPWLVNALAHEVTWKMKENRDRSITITPEMLLIPTDDLQYVADMGLIKREKGKPRRIANTIYQEVIPRELTWTTQDGLIQEPQWYQNTDGSINMEKLLLDFQQFFRQNADSWIQKFDYAEAGPQLLLQAFLQRIVNGGGYIDREYGLGRRRTDLLIRKPLTDGYGGPVQRIVLELKIKHGSLEKVINEGLRQTFDYMDTVGSVDEGHLIIFDRSKDKTWEERIWHRQTVFNNRPIMVWGM